MGILRLLNLYSSENTCLRIHAISIQQNLINSINWLNADRLSVLSDST